MKKYILNIRGSFTPWIRLSAEQSKKEIYIPESFVTEMLSHAISLHYKYTFFEQMPSRICWYSKCDLNVSKKNTIASQQKKYFVKCQDNISESSKKLNVLKYKDLKNMLLIIILIYLARFSKWNMLIKEK